MNPNQFLKAIYAVVVGSLIALGGYLTTADTTLGDITTGQWVYVALAGLVAGGGVYGIKNALPTKKPEV